MDDIGDTVAMEITPNLGRLHETIVELDTIDILICPLEPMSLPVLEFLSC